MTKRTREIEGHQAMEAPSAADKKKTKSNADAPGAGIFNDVLDNIFARLPARTAVASMVLSKHHHALISSPEFRSLHFRLSPPLSDPHIAYIGEFNGFHVAGAGHNSDAPMPGGMYYHQMKYINTCNGILLFAYEQEREPPTCVLWNPAIADGVKEFTVPCYTRKPDANRRLEPICRDDPGDYSILGLCYSERSKSYKLLLTYRQKQLAILLSNPPKSTYCKELLVYTLGGAAGETPRLVKLSSQGRMDLEISQESLYIDGVVYLLYTDSDILAVDIDEEKVEYIDLPGSRRYPCENCLTSELMQISGRPCLVKNDDGQRALWILTADHRWERRCVFKVDDDPIFCPIKGVWDYNGVIVMYLYNKAGESKLLLYEVATGKMIMENLSSELTPKESHYSICWGYKPSLLPPESIVVDQDDVAVKERKPSNKQDKRKVSKAAQCTTRFIQYLVRIMEKLPGNMQEITMPLLNSEDQEDFLSHN